MKLPSLTILAFMLLALPLTAAEPNSREVLLKKMEAAMGPMPKAERKVPLDVKELSSENCEGYTRKKITYAAEKGDRVPAWLLIPQGKVEGQRPAMLCLHQTIRIGKDEPVGLGEQESKRQAVHLVQRGYICIVPDYPSFGEYPYDFASAFQRGDYQSGTMKAIWNNMRAVDLLCAMPEVDAKRIGAIGHSLGGHNTLFTAAFDERIQVAVSSCGFCSFAKYYGGNLKGWTSDRYMPKIARDFNNDPKKVPFDFDDVLLAICPRAVFAMAPLHDSNFDVQGVKDVITKVKPAFEKSKAGAKLKAIYPDAKHEWPDDARKEAYEFIDGILMNRKK